MRGSSPRGAGMRANNKKAGYWATVPHFYEQLDSFPHLSFHLSISSITDACVSIFWPLCEVTPRTRTCGFRQ